MPANSLKSRTKGYLLGVLGVLILSPDTLLIRLVDTSPWTFLTWRGGLMTIGMILVLSLSYRSKLLEKIHAIGWLGLLVALIFAINTTFFQLSVQTTNVANTLVIIATAPLFAAILSVIFLKERIPVRTWVTILICFLAVGLVFAGRLDGGHLFGNFAALISAIGLGTHFVLVRLKREVDMTPAIGLASLLTCFIGFNMSSDLYLEPQQLGFLAILGLILLPISFILLTRAPIYISAPEVSLVILLETILAPIWVWLAIQEEPPLTTLIGGGVIIIVLAIHAIQSRNNR